MKLYRRKMKPIMWLVIAALGAELFICNLSAWKSLFYKDGNLFEQINIEGGKETKRGSADYIVDKGLLTVHIPEVNQEIDNLFFELEFSENKAVPYTVTLTDEGNYYPYALPEGYLMPGVKKSFYTNIYPSGEVGELILRFTVPAGSMVSVDGICANVRMPFVFSISRFLIVMGVFLCIYFMRTPGRMHDTIYSSEINKKNRGQLFITAAMILAFIGLAWQLAHVNPVCIASPWPHHKQYQELAEAMSEGHVDLDMEPSEGLLNAENPYDTIYLKANRIDYKADYAYYEGKYYVYFGVVPELLLYLPCYLLTGHNFPNYMAVFLFYCGFIMAVFALYREIIKQWFPKTPFFIYLLVSGLTVCCGNYLFVIARPDLYDVPIMAAAMFTSAGLWLWIKGKYLLGKGKRLCFLSGSLCMALVAGCRPQMLLFSCLAIPLFWDEVIKKRELFSKRSLRDTACICIPYILVAAGIMCYNAARFGSPFDFGATYSLTSNDMTKRSFNVPQMLLGLWHYFLQPPLIGSDFPFLQGNQINAAAYMGKLSSEYTYGGMLACNVFTWIVLAVGKGKEELKKKGIYAFVLVNIVISVIISVADVTGAGILQRYMVDMIWGLWFAAAIVMLLLVEKTQNTKYYHVVMSGLAVICLLQAAYAFGVVFGNGDLNVNVRSSNPYLYYHVKSLFMF